MPTTDRVHFVDGIRRSERVKAPSRAALTPLAALSRRFLGCTSGTDTKSNPSAITLARSDGRFGTLVSSFPNTSVRGVKLVASDGLFDDDEEDGEEFSIVLALERKLPC